MAGAMGTAAPYIREDAGGVSNASEFASSNRGPCSDCGADLPSPARTGRPRKLCDRCRAIHRIRVHVHIARLINADLSPSIGEVEMALNAALKAATP